MNTQQELIQLDPATLTVDTNVRKDAGPTAAFVASIRDLGVLEPVIARRNAEGIVHVLMGQRRTLAAVEAQLPTIPVVVIDSPEEADRIITQVVENIQRAELGHADQAKATEAGTKALDSGHDLEAALIFAEFADDPDSTKEIESVLADEPDQLHHVAQQLRDKREAVKVLNASIADLEAKVITNVGEFGCNDDNRETARVTNLLRPDGTSATDDDGNAFGIRRYYHGGDTVLLITGVEDQCSGKSR